MGQPRTGPPVRVAWVLDAFLAVVSVPTLAFSLFGWVLYRLRRADLDAQGAEAMGELLAAGQLTSLPPAVAGDARMPVAAAVGGVMSRIAVGQPRPVV